MRKSTIIVSSVVAASLLVGLVGGLFVTQQGRLENVRQAEQKEHRRAEVALTDKDEAMQRLDGAQERLETARESEERLRENLEAAQSTTDNLEQDNAAKEALLDELWTVQGLQTDCHNAWVDFTDGYYERSIAEDQSYIDHAVAVCEGAAASFNAVLNRQGRPV